jgi:lysozyme
MQISEAGLALIKGQEGFRSHPYQDIGGVWTRGYGETSGIGPDSPAITQQEGEAHLKLLVDTQYGSAVNALRLPLSQHQFDACCDFVYNLGTGVLEEGSTFGSYLRAMSWSMAANSMLLYDHDNGVVIPDLQHRRELDRALFLSPEAPRANPLDVLTRTERHAVEIYKAAERHPHLHEHALKELHAELVGLRKTIWLAAERGELPHGKTKPGWQVEHRDQRYRILLSLTRG